MIGFWSTATLLLFLLGSVRSGEEGPQFTRSWYNTTIPENSVSKTYVTCPEMMGMYVSDPALDVRFKIVSGDKDRFFKAEARRIGDFCFLAIRTRTGTHAVLNREYQDSYKLEVRATVGNAHKRKIKMKAQTTVNVAILDTNDLNPLFYPTEYQVNVSEDTPLYRSLLRVSAFDPDLGVNGEIYYRFLQPIWQFAIHPTRGVVTLSRPLSHQKQSRYRLSVVAEDRGPKFRTGDVRASSATVEIEVIPVNLHSPEIFVRYFPTIMDPGPETILAVVSVADEDPGIHGQIRKLEIVGGDPEGRFRLIAASDPGRYHLMANGGLVSSEYTLTIRATDSGIPPKSTRQTLHLKLPEASDGPPVFIQSYYEASVSEVAPMGTPVLQVSASGPRGRQSEIFYSSEGDQSDFDFSVDSRTGWVYVAAPLDREVKSQYTWVVGAVDRSIRGVRPRGTAQITVQILDANDNDPIFNSTSVWVEVDENRPVGSPVYTVAAEDADQGENGYVSYSLANLSPVPFQIDPFTGRITTTTVLDYETMRRRYLLKVRASDWGTPFRRQSETTVGIRVRDVNDHRPLFEKVDCVVYLSSALPVNTPVFRLSAVDFDAGSTVTYRTVPSGRHPCFSLNSTTGQLSVNCDLSQQKYRQTRINVTASDGQHFSDVVPVILEIVGSGSQPTSVECRDLGVAQRLKEQNRLGELNNESEDSTQPTPTTYRGNRHRPEFPIQSPTRVRVNESASVGWPVATLKARDADRGYNGRLVYALTSGHQDGCFGIDLFEGIIRVQQPLDREEKDAYVLNVTVWDLGQPSKSAHRLLSIDVADVNDNPPVFEKSSYDLVVPENVRNGTSIVRLRATDEDAGPNAELRFRMDTPTDRFQVSTETGLLSVRAPLDRETTDEYRLKVVVTDSGSPNPLSSITTVNIRVLDINDNPPKFALPQFWVKLPEDLPPGSVVMALSAHDPDLEGGGKVEYRISAGADGKFSIDPEMGVVRLDHRLDFERTQLYNLTITARDGGLPPLSAVASLVVEVEDVDENAHRPRFPDLVATAAVRENAPAGTLVTRLTAVDDDGPGSDGRVIYSVADGDGLGLFSIDAEGGVRTRCPLDRETSSRYWLTIHARDAAAVPLSTHMYLYVEVEDENDNIPLTFDPIYYANVRENSAEGTMVTKLKAFDLDSDPDQRIVYGISNGDSDGHFTIDSVRGIISTTSKKLDREKREEYILEVTINDSGKPPLFSVTRVVVRIEDENDNDPEFLLPKYHCHVLEKKKSSENDPLCQVIAVDMDSSSNGDITYNIVEGDHKGKFKIHPKDGTITSHSNLIAGQKFELIVKASDNGQPVRIATTRVLLDIIATHKNSIHPPIVKDSDTIAVVAETDQIGDLVALVEANDVDGDRLWYSIYDGNKGNVFMMQQPDSGAILLRKQLHWEMHSKYNLTIAITDGIHIVYHMLQVEVKDGNNHQPQFSEQTYNVDVSENIKPGTEILQLQAMDKDQDKRLFYSIVNSASYDSQKKFYVDSTHGIISIAHPLDHELCHKHILTVMVNDYGTPSKRDFARMIVNVLDHNDFIPEFLLSKYEAFILETSALGTAVLQVKAIDRDRGKNAQLSYSITSGNIGNFFIIDSAFGIIKVSKQLNRNSMPEFFLTVRVTDHGNPPLNSTVTVHIIVTVANNAPPKFDLQEFVAEIYEDAKPGTSVAVLMAASRSSVFYEIVSGNIDESFSINPTSGIVYTNTLLDYESNNFYNLTIQATNLMNGNSTTLLLVHVLDKNDNQPIFIYSEYKGKILETSKVGSIVLTNESYPLVVTATDNDSGLNSMLSYKINEKFDSKYFKIDQNTGAVRSKLPLDYEEIKEFIFTVQVIDHGWPQLSAEVPAIVYISVINVNDRPPSFEKTIYTANLLLPTYQGVLVISVHAIDPDSDNVKYSIVSGNWGQKFLINESSGDIFVKSSLGLNKEYNIVVSATDGEFEANSKLIIIVDDIQPSSKQFSEEVYRVSILENLTTSHILTAVNIIGSHLDEHVSFKILNPSDRFNIGETSGVIQSTGIPFDRETCSNYPLVIEARSKNLEEVWVAHTIVNITILDVNDNKPIFINTPYYTVVPLETLPGHSILKVKAIDLDLGVNSQVHYELVEGDYNIFRLDSDTGEIFLHTSLDGQKKEYELIISAVDGGSPSLYTQVTVPIKIINRAMPVFNKHYYNISVKEDISANVPILTVSANNPERRQLIYSLVDGNNMEDFQLDYNAAPANTNGPCIIYATEELDYETTQQYWLTLRATDAVSGIYAEIPIHITVEDVNDNPPMFSQPIYNTSVSEAMPFGTSILVVRATDRDSEENQQIRYHIHGNATTHFYVDQDEGIVIIKQPLDHETEQHHHFIVIGTDKGTPHLSSTAHIWIIVKDINDNPPSFHYPTYSCAVSENARHGQFITRVIAMDPDISDQKLLRYSIVDGNGMQVFSIHHKTGIITLSNLHQFSQQSSYFLNISVTDGVFSSFTRVHISVYSANLHSPQFTRTIYEVAFQENQEPGTYVTTVTARDKDSGEYGRITYNLQSDLLQKYFRIHPDSGKIYTSIILDREEQHLFEIPVVAFDGGNKLAYCTVRITVTDDNDNTPQFVAAQYKATLAANTTIGTTILKVQAIDVDDKPSGSLDFSIYDTNISSSIEIFGITSMNGEIYLKKKIVDFGNHYFQFFVRAQDHGIPSKFSVVPVTIHLLSSPVVIPQFEHTNLEYFISEQSPIGTIISVLNVTNPTSVPIVYSIVDVPEESVFKSYVSKFSIDRLGHLLLMSELDREQENIYFLTIQAKTKIKPYILTYANLVIHVMDENDNPPLFETSSYHIIVAENIEEGSAILKVTAHDSDVGRNADIIYRFSDDLENAAAMFHLNSKTGWLTTIDLLDRETVPCYNFTIIAEDSGFPSFSSSTLVSIQLQDYNDNPPVFHLQRYTSSVPEDALPGTILVRVDITDSDENIDNVVDYYITDGNPKDQFDIRQTGEVFVNKPLDREDIANYLLEVTITDGKFVTQTRIDVDIIDVNDNSPICLKSKYTELVSESIAADTYILTIKATDADDFRNAQLKYFLTGYGSEDFFIDSSSGLLKTAKAMDREQNPRYNLKAHVQDQNRPEWECSSQVEILLGDVNDNAPMFSQEIYSVAVPEDSEVGTLVTKVHATDKDLGYNRKVTYSFVDSAHEHFFVDKTTGIVQLKKPLDREDRAMYNLTIQAEDHGTPQLSASAILLVMVQDVNDNPPEFAQRFYFATVSETSTPGTKVLRVLATSKDSGVNAEISYSLIGGNDMSHFTIHAKSGIISVAEPLDYETTHEYMLIIQATDGGTPPLNSQTTVNITLSDANDNAPVFMQSSYRAVIREDAVVGDKIIQVMATDLDSISNAQLSYSIVGGDRQNQFIIDNLKGYISLLSNLDREKISAYVLEIECTDSGIPPLSTVGLVNIEVSDVNDNPPRFSQANYTALVQEGKPLGFTILKFSVTDIDAPPNTSPFKFDILSGNEEMAFRIVQQDGTLRTATKFDHKYRSEYILHIKVTDNGNPSLHSETWVTIIVIEESQYAPIITPLDVAVSSYLDDFPGGVVGRVHAIDEDPYDKLIYDIISPHQSLFTVDREDGTLFALAGLDVGIYDVNISVSDGKFTSFTTVSVEVAVVTEDARKHSVAIRLNDVTPEDFLLTYRKGFHRGLRNILNVRTKDIEIISMQPTVEENIRNERSTHQDLDVVFAVHKGNHGFYPPKLVQSKIKEKKEALEASLGLSIVKIMENRCTSDKCIYGQCVDHIVLDRTSAYSITTDVLSYVSPHHYRKLECQCDPGYGGSQCDMAINECARKPCPVHRMCVSDSSPLGYSCECPPGKSGPLCDWDKEILCEESNCYEEKKPISFGGKSYACYILAASIDRHLSIVLHLRTKQSTGNLMFSAGIQDYSILEIQNGLVQYRLDCGSGEGLIRVEHAPVNDGNWHEVRLERRGNTAELVVDRRYRASGISPGFYEVLNLDGSDVYFGAEVRMTGYTDVRMGFVGCMDEILINGISLPLHVTASNPVATLRRFVNVEFHCRTLFDPGVCGSQPCQNGGTCQSTDNAFTCQCLPRFLGTFCEIDTNPCDSNPCLNGGTCHNVNRNFQCDCPVGLSGKRCDYGRYCNPNPCRNNGVCEEGTANPICKCPGFHGELCQYDIDECQNNPCAAGATCINMHGAFQCQCPPNMTGSLCMEHIYITSITSSSWNTTIEEIIGIALVIFIIFLLALMLVCCWRYRYKRYHQRPNNENVDVPGHNEFLLKNPVGEKENLQRYNKITNLEVTNFATPPLPPRPSSYTPTTQESLIALNNFDRVRSYGSAADDLDNIPRYTSDLQQNTNRALPVSIAPNLPPLPSSNSASDSESLRKNNWEHENSNLNDKVFEDKIQIDLVQPKSKAFSVSHPIPAVPSRGPSSLGVSSVISMNSADDLPANPLQQEKKENREDYQWDYSDWTSSTHKAKELNPNKSKDSSSVPSTESNSQLSQIELLPCRSLVASRRGTNELQDGEDLDFPDSYVGDSEYNDNDLDEAQVVVPNFQQLLTDLEFMDDGTDTLSPSPKKYQSHPNQYLPAHFLSSDISPDSSIHPRKITSEFSDDEIVPYGFPSQGRRTFQLDPENSDPAADQTSGLDSLSMSVGGYTSTNASYSDISGMVCEIEDSDLDCDTGSRRPPRLSRERTASTAV